MGWPILTNPCDLVSSVQQPGHHGHHGGEEDEDDEDPRPGDGAPLLGHWGVTHVDVPLDCQGCNTTPDLLLSPAVFFLIND